MTSSLRRKRRTIAAPNMPAPTAVSFVTLGLLFLSGTASAQQALSTQTELGLYFQKPPAAAADGLLGVPNVSPRSTLFFRKEPGRSLPTLGSPDSSMGQQLV